MIGTLSYDEMANIANSIETSSNNIKVILDKYNSDKLVKVKDFCDTIDAYSRFLATNVELYKDSEDALKFMLEKNK